MRGKHEDKSTKDHKMTFANAVIVLCLVVSLFITLDVVYEYHRLCVVMSADAITSLMRLWGGELLIVALRQVLGSDAVFRMRRHTSFTDDDSSMPI